MKGEGVHCRGWERNRTWMGRVRNPARGSQPVGCWGTWLPCLGEEFRHRGKSPGPPKLSLCTRSAHPPTLPTLLKTHFLSVVPLVEKSGENPTSHQALGPVKEWESQVCGEIVTYLVRGSAQNVVPLPCLQTSPHP